MKNLYGVCLALIVLTTIDLIRTGKGMIKFKMADLSKLYEVFLLKNRATKVRVGYRITKDVTVSFRTIKARIITSVNV